MKRSRLFVAIICLLIPWMNLQLRAQQPDKNKHKSSNETKLNSKEVNSINYDKAVKLIKLIRNSLERIYCTRNDYKNPKKDEEIKELRGLLNELIKKYENIIPSLRKELDQQRIEYKQAFVQEDVDKVLKTHQKCKKLESIIYELNSVLSNANEKTPDKKVDKKSTFSDKRAKFTTNIVEKRKAPGKFKKETPPDGVSEVTYQSGTLSLKAWLAKPKEAKSKYPAVVYLHQDYAFSKVDWTSASAFLKAGFVLMTPMLRGENGNPGNFEFFYGEVDDAIAAGKYVANLSYVDKNKVFIAGHTIGGAIATLVSLLPSPYKAAASYSGAPLSDDYFSGFEGKRIGGKFPFENTTKEKSMRQAYNHMKDIQCPLYIFLGSQEGYLKEYSSQIWMGVVRYLDTCEKIEVPGNINSALKPAIAKTIEKFKALPK